MFQHSISFASPISSLCFAANVLYVLLNNNAIHVIGKDSSSAVLTSDSPVVQLFSDSPLPPLRQLTWHSSGRLLALSTSVPGDAVIILDPSTSPVPPPVTVSLPRRAVRLYASSSYDAPPLVLLEDSSIWQLRIQPLLLTEFLVGGAPLRLPAPSHTISYVTLANVVQ